jgi:hypothetical protein
MKYHVKVILGVALIAPLFVLGVVIAHEGEHAVLAQETTTQAKPDAEQLKERIEKRKADLKTKITLAQQNRIKSRCKSSQGLVASVDGRIKGIETSRAHVYENLVSRLTKVSEKLKNAGVATAELDAQIAELQTKITTFNTNLATYKQAVTDLGVLDCVADPTAFQASLDAARLARKQVTEDSKAIKAYTKETIKATLAGLKSQLGNKTEGEE